MVVILFLIITTLSWGFTPILEKVALTRVDPLVVLILREEVTLPRVVGTAFIVIGIWFVK